MKHKKIYLYLCGGLGNQMFQYAAAKNIAINNNAQIIIDSATGFYSDFRDYWRFSLNKKKLSRVSYCNFNLFFIIFRILNKVFKIREIFIKILGLVFINESKVDKFIKEIENFKFKNRLFLLGYFQSEKYFFKNKKKIINEIAPPKPRKKNFINLAKKIKSTNSVAIGLRFHETMPANIYFKIGGITSIKFYEDAIKKLLKKEKKPVFFIFSTKNSHIKKLLKKAKVIKKFQYFLITDASGYSGSAMDNLWLMSQCKSHIFSNSTFYWWAAYFSQNIFNVNKKKPTIICSGNFPNLDTCIKSWKLKN